LSRPAKLWSPPDEHGSAALRVPRAARDRLLSEAPGFRNRYHEIALIEKFARSLMVFHAMSTSFFPQENNCIQIACLMIDVGARPRARRSPPEPAVPAGPGSVHRPVFRDLPDRGDPGGVSWAGPRARASHPGAPTCLDRG